MKKICTLLIITSTLLNHSQAQNYKIKTSNSWSSVTSNSYYCSGCKFDISSGVTLTLNLDWSACANCSFTGGNIIVSKNFTCQGCTFNVDNLTINNNISFQSGTTFNGGNIDVEADATCQGCTFKNNTISVNNHVLKLESSTTSFTNVNFTVSGTGGINSTAGVSATNSTFTFSNTSYFNNNGGQLNLSASGFYFFDNAYLNATSGPINLSGNSKLVAGNGSVSSGAYLYFNGPAVNVDGGSFISIAGKNNYYFNWSNYSGDNKSYSTPSKPYLYGCALLNSSGYSSCTLLAASFSSFNASLDNGIADLQWTTAEETNTDHFIVERSADAASWETAGTVKASGNAAANHDYHFSDPFPLTGISYYRLAIVDIDGTTNYSKTVSIQQAAAGAIRIFPDPIVNSSFTIKLPNADAATINIFTVQGQLLYRTSLKGQMQYQIKLPAAPQNNYMIIEVIIDGKTQALTVLNK